LSTYNPADHSLDVLARGDMALDVRRRSAATYDAGRLCDCCRCQLYWSRW